MGTEGKVGWATTWGGTCDSVQCSKLTLEVINFFEVDQIFGENAHVRYMGWAVTWNSTCQKVLFADIEQSK